jgi:cysteine-rich repeat protein
MRGMPTTTARSASTRSGRSGTLASGMRWVLGSILLASVWMGAGCADLLGIDFVVAVPLCGNGALEISEGEECDDGGDSATCNRNCTWARCGDGLFNPAAGEECDEGSESATCDHDCTLPRCGDGYINAAAGETCDVEMESAACDRDCTAPVCGDGLANQLAAETCDDGNLDATDACTTSCQWAECGDGFTRAGLEECDDGNSDDTDACMAWCAAASCDDGLRNGGESALDCGGACAATCGAGHSCAGDHDCASRTCSGGRCVANRLVTGSAHTCALLEGGGVRCWGRNERGQLGYGNQDEIGDDEAPNSVDLVDVGGRAVQLTAGGSHTCALLEGGAVRCWGNNSHGQLGRGNTAPIENGELPGSVAPVDAGGRVVQLAAGDLHTCALLEGGEARCWGYNEDGRLGYGHTSAIGDSAIPRTVDVGGPVVQLAAGGSHTCALMEDGGVRCWGSGEDGKLGYGHTNAIGDDETPSVAGDVNVGGHVVQLAAGGAHTCALLEHGKVRCWGSNGDGQLGYGHTSQLGDSEVPASAGDVDVGGRTVQLAAGSAHTCALLDDGALRCWGSNWAGALGLGHENTIGDSELPASVDVVNTGGRAVEIAAGGNHTCALLDDDALRCWGHNSSGQLGLAHTIDIGGFELPVWVSPVSYR